MYVIADIEWVKTKSGVISPVQLATARVDGNWNQVNSFYSFIKPIDNDIFERTKVAFNGGTPVFTPYQHSNTKFNINARFIGNRHNLNHR